MQALIGNILDRCITDAGYRGHNAPPDHKFKVYTSGQKRRVTPQIKREFNRRAAIEPVIGHPCPCQRRRHQRLLAAAGYNFRRLLACCLDLHSGTESESCWINELRIRCIALELLIVWHIVTPSRRPVGP